MTKEILFSNKVDWKGGYEGELSFPDGNIEFALPAQFKGVKGFLSPEDLYVGAANACVLTTTLSRARKYGVTIEAFESSAEGLMKSVEGGLEITEITINARLKADGDRETLEKMIAEIVGRVPVIKSMKTKVNLDMKAD
ncbi:MAG: OsmC family protein [Methanotrichaceae archaeon]